MSSSALTAARTSARPSLAGWLPAYFALAAIWGSSFLFIKVGVRELHPTYVALGRCGAGALTLVVVVLVTRDRLPRQGRLWGHLAVIALIGNVIPFTLFGYGERKVSSIVAGIWNATTPLMVLVVALAFLPAERPNRRRVAGLGLGFAGVLVVLGVWQGIGGAELTGQLCCALAAACYGVAIPYTRRITIGHTGTGVSFAAVQLILATAELAVVAPFVGGAPPVPWRLSGDVLLCVLLLGALGTGLAFALNYRVISQAGATMSASVTYLTPIFAVALGVLVLDEHLHWYEPVGALIILVGVALAQGLNVRGKGRAAARSPHRDESSPD